MLSLEQLKELRDSVRNLSGPDRQTDFKVYGALGINPYRFGGFNGLTSSTDLAINIAKEIGFYVRNIHETPDSKNISDRVGVELFPISDNWHWRTGPPNGLGATRPLAIIEALLSEKIRTIEHGST